MLWSEIFARKAGFVKGNSQKDLNALKQFYLELDQATSDLEKTQDVSN